MLRVKTIDVVQPPVFMTAALKRKQKNLLSAASHLVTCLPVARALPVHYPAKHKVLLCRLHEM